MGTRRLAPLLLAVAAAWACTEQQQAAEVTGLQSARPPSNSAECDPNSLNSLISGYFPGSRSADIKTLKDAMIGAATDEDSRDFGFQVLDSIGALSRDASVTADLIAGSELTKGIIKCMFEAEQFDPDFPSDPIYGFDRALSKADGGAFYVRGDGAGGTDTLVGATFTPTGMGEDTTVLSGITPAGGASWTSILAGNAGSEGRVLIYGFLKSSNPFVYEWATIPPAATFDPGAIVAVCDDNTATNAMVHESNIGILHFSSGNAICDADVPLAMDGSGWGPRRLAARLARTLLASITPEKLQAAVVGFRSGSGGTVTTAKSEFSTKPVQTVTFEFVAPKPPRRIFLSEPPVTIRVRATTSVDGVETGVNGVCVYLVGSENNGTNTALGGGNHECQNEPEGAISVITKSLPGGDAGYATFSMTVTKTGGLTLTATSEDASGNTGVIGRDGQVFIDATARTNVNP